MLTTPLRVEFTKHKGRNGTINQARLEIDGRFALYAIDYNADRKELIKSLLRQAAERVFSGNYDERYIKLFKHSDTLGN